MFFVSNFLSLLINRKKHKHTCNSSYFLSMDTCNSGGTAKSFFPGCYMVCTLYIILFLGVGNMLQLAAVVSYLLYL